MSFLSSLSRKLGFTGGDEDERDEELEENELEDEEEEEEEESSFSFKFPFGGARRNRQQNVAYEEDEEEEPSPQSRREGQSGYSSRRGNVIHDARMDARAAQEAQYTHCERIVNVRQIEECREIIKHLLHGESVLLNLENIDPKDCGRVVDLLSGAAFALQGRMIKVAHLSYLLAPENVEIIEEDMYAAGHARYR
ncbi:MAG: cell division protein SepF [Clostridia bacterium]|nr:cell division protein SepF [Clostridia bacterium]